MKKKFLNLFGTILAILSGDISQYSTEAFGQLNIRQKVWMPDSRQILISSLVFTLFSVIKSGAEFYYLKMIAVKKFEFLKR